MYEVLYENYNNLKKIISVRRIVQENILASAMKRNDTNLVKKAQDTLRDLDMKEAIFDSQINVVKSFKETKAKCESSINLIMRSIDKIQALTSETRLCQKLKSEFSDNFKNHYYRKIDDLEVEMLKSFRSNTSFLRDYSRNDYDRIADWTEAKTKPLPTLGESFNIDVKKSGEMPYEFNQMSEMATVYRGIDAKFKKDINTVEFLNNVKILNNMRESLELVDTLAQMINQMLPEFKAIDFKIDFSKEESLLNSLRQNLVEEIAKYQKVVEETYKEIENSISKSQRYELDLMKFEKYYREYALLINKG